MAAGDLITADWQIEWRGVLLGSGTPYGWRELDGWLDLPGMRIGDQPRPGRHGAYAGQQLADERVITWELTVLPYGSVSFAAAVDTLRRITAAEEAPDEEPLVIRLSGTSWLANARCTRRSLPADRMYTAQASPAVIQWVATDPRLYSPQQQQLTVGLPSPGAGGLVFPLVFPLTFGTGLAGGNLAVTNTGTVTTWPTWQITGPVTGPVITNVDTGQQLQFDPAFVVGAGQTLIIDTDAKTVTLQGVNRRDRLFVADWFGLRGVLPNGSATPTNVRFTAAGGFTAGTLTALWRHATI